MDITPEAVAFAEDLKLNLLASLKEYGKQMRRNNPKLSRSAKLIEFAWTALDIMNTLDDTGSDLDDDDFTALEHMKLAYEIVKGRPIRERE